ncbi:MAG: translation initiation factor IF-2 [Candidatus Omnitrophica bacterium]|nr:translation initiation factor IF-2 [Candidatus Omnitrophota bacterium]
MRVFELAKETGISSKELMALLAKLKIKAASHMAALDEESVRKVRASLKKPGVQEKEKATPKKAAAEKTPAQEKPAETAAPRKAKPAAPVVSKPAVAAAPPILPAAKPKPPEPLPAAKKPVLPTPAPAPVSRQPAAPPPVKPAPAAVVPPQKAEAVKSPEPAKEAPPKAQPPSAPPTPPALKPITVRFPITVKELAEKLSISPGELIKRLMSMKMMLTINQLLTEETGAALLKMYGYEHQQPPTLEEKLKAAQEAEDPAKLKPRPPVVTFMGHVDHGKTSLLDAIRKTKVVDEEAGGITQHIGAYRVVLPKGSITFLDTPGHEAFTAMRARGAHVTDLVIVVVAADDGVMPQTVEAIDHARAADATIVVALNKIDKPSANADKVKKQLMQMGLTPEDWGGKTIVVPVSAKTGQGIDQLLEMILLEAEIMELKADPTKPARGIVLEASLSKGGGPIAHVLIQSGTLRVGDVLVSGPYWGKVRAMLDERGHRLKEAGPSTPVELMGLNGVPKAGDSILVVPDERQAREIVGRRQEESKVSKGVARRPVSLEDFHKQLQAGELKSLNLILKADVQGSVEAIRHQLEKISSEEVSLKILHVGVGDVTEPDILLAEASDAVVIGFHVGMTPEAANLAKQEGVDVRIYRIIYEAINDVKAALEGMLEPKMVETVLGKAKVLQVFKVSGIGTVAGCQVVKGKAVRGAVARVYRGQEMVHEGKITSLKRFKEDAREVAEGYQCGIGVGGWNGFAADDIIEVVEVAQVAAKL